MLPNFSAMVIQDHPVNSVKPAAQTHNSASVPPLLFNNGIIAVLSKAYPTHGILAEESGLREGQGDAAETRHLAERVDASLRAAEELLDGLLDVSRLDAGAVVPVVGLFAARRGRACPSPRRAVRHCGPATTGDRKSVV